MALGSVSLRAARSASVARNLLIETNCMFGFISSLFHYRIGGNDLAQISLIQYVVGGFEQIKERHTLSAAHFDVFGWILSWFRFFQKRLFYNLAHVAKVQ